MVSSVPDIVEEISHMYLDSYYGIPLPPADRIPSKGKKNLVAEKTA